jgi:hypothetical protein
MQAPKVQTNSGRVEMSPEDDKDYTINPVKHERKMKILIKQLKLQLTNEMHSPRSGAVYKGYID